MPGHAASRKVAGSISDEVIGFCNLPNPAAVWPWGRLEMTTRNLPGGQADYFTAICEPVV
jgi:hypothetical protein